MTEPIRLQLAGRVHARSWAALARGVRRVSVRQLSKQLVLAAEHLADTDPSVKIWRIVSASSDAHDRTTTLSGAPGRSGMVSVTTTCSNGESASRS